MRGWSDAELRELLGLSRVATVGFSSTPGTDAHEVPKYLVEHGYDVIPVNPNADSILGRTSYPSLSDVPGPIDVVQVFRPGNEVPGLVDEILKRDDVTVLWLQLGITNPEATRRAREHGLHVVVDRCMRQEHRRLLAP